MSKANELLKSLEALEAEHPGEEQALLGAAGQWLQRLIIAALETGCRRGELLSLQWQDVSLSRGEIMLEGPEHLVRAFPIWFGLHPYASVERPTGRPRLEPHTGAASRGEGSARSS